MPPMLAAEPEPLSEREEAGGDEDELRGSVARPLVRHPAREERRRRGRGGGQREEEPGTSRQADREVVEDVAGLAGNGRLDSRCSVRGGSRGREAEAGGGRCSRDGEHVPRVELGAVLEGVQRGRGERSAAEGERDPRPAQEQRDVLCREAWLAPP